MSLVKGSLIGLGSAGALGTGGYFAWRSQQPTDVKSRLVWDGLSVAESKSLGVYKALYLANSTKSGFSSFVTADDKEKAAPLIKSKCDKLLDVSVSSKEYESALQEAKKWCLVPEKSTIEIALLLEDSEFSSAEDDYKNTFALNKSSQDFIDVIKNGDSNLKTSSDVSTGFQKVKDWCNKVIKQSPIDVDLRNAKAWCLKGPLDIKEKLVKDGLVVIGEGGWQQGYVKHKSDSTFLSEISASPAPEQDSEGGNKLKTWCESKFTKKLHENDYFSTYEKVRKYCTK
ncbi:hypothetical protein HF1_09440 [Mycoplasma haemofelis str. Langford 1]|uniref:Uncharacterized protein n=1 Tax=Mycoplasma haemofelis (strain Langford 1) TaxID=941640 RepID=E8ZII1_MYCHL|nr:hypothetical protein [Mycoplasma haemofelis]CBY92952.1 hypothetical protein HF1_09440 [Mycoplasma haemofelis str. Langford 1]